MRNEGYLLGLDIGSSSVKASLISAATGKTVVAAQSPADEMLMLAVHPGWAEQDPDVWWEHARRSIGKCMSESGAAPSSILSIGIAYQMHGLVLIDRDGHPLRPSIIWCDSRAVQIGNEAQAALGTDYCLRHLLNSPGNFTASKLKWVQLNEPGIYEKIHKVMLPGDYIAMKLTGEIGTTDTGLSEGIFWDYQEKTIAGKLMDYYRFDPSLLAPIVPVFSVHGKVRRQAAEELGLAPGIPVAYRAGDQPNNAFSLNVLNPGETAATAGTSGVIYSVTDRNAFDVRSRVNGFIHVNNTLDAVRNGVLMCVNGTGIQNSWLRKMIRHEAAGYGYPEINALAAEVPIGSGGVVVLPFGNGAERILENREIGSSVAGLNFNTHHQGHLFRAAQEGIVFALNYGFEILREMGLAPTVIRAGNANMFLSPVFREAFVNTTGTRIELFDTDGARGAALGAGIGAGIYGDFKDAFRGLSCIGTEEPDREKKEAYDFAFQRGKKSLTIALQHSNSSL